MMHRLYALDFLRAFALLMGIFLHVPMLFFGTCGWFRTKAWSFHYLRMDTHLAHAVIHAFGRFLYRY